MFRANKNSNRRNTCKSNIINSSRNIAFPALCLPNNIRTGNIRPIESLKNCQRYQLWFTIRLNQISSCIPPWQKSDVCYSFIIIETVVIESIIFGLNVLIFYIRNDVNLNKTACWQLEWFENGPKEYSYFWLQLFFW